jgi:hypothetical protein
MSRKSLVGVLFVLLATVAVAGAAEKVDNVFIAGVDADYFVHTGWVGSNYSGGIGGSLFFGYGITKNFAIEADWMPDIMSAPTGKDVKNAQNAAYWGGIGQKDGGMGGLGLSGKLYPRERFRDSDFVIAQPYARLGLGWMPFIWTNKNPGTVVTKNAGFTTTTTTKAYDGFNDVYLNLGGGCDFMITKFFSLGPEVRMWKYFVVGKTLQGYSTSSYHTGDYQNSLGFSLGLNVTFQW